MTVSMDIEHFMDIEHVVYGYRNPAKFCAGKVTLNFPTAHAGWTRLSSLASRW